MGKERAGRPHLLQTSLPYHRPSMHPDTRHRRADRLMTNSDVVVMVRLSVPGGRHAARETHGRRRGAVHLPDRGGAAIAAPNQVVVVVVVDVTRSHDVPVGADAVEETGCNVA